MKKASEVLIESEKTRIQITGNLVRLDLLKDNPRITGYCALGALACEKKMITNQNVLDHPPSYNDILLSYGLNPWAKVQHPEVGYINKQEVCNLIWRLNDTYKWSFKQIGKWLAKFEDQIKLPEHLIGKTNREISTQDMRKLERVEVKEVKE